MATITISKQPVAQNLYVGQTPKALSVVASVSPTESLSYQWYTAEDASKKNPQQISGATDASLILESSEEVADTFYYCTVTGTTATAVTSNVVKVSIQAMPEYLTGAQAIEYINACDTQIQERFTELQTITGITIESNTKALTSRQLKLVMEAI